MPRLMKKASIVTTLESAGGVVTLARALAEPADFYAGRRHVEHRLPDNILLFHRQRAAELTNPTAAKAFHQRHVLIVPLRGSGRVVAEARSILLSPGRCVLIAPFQFHHYTAFSQPDIDWLFVTFTYGGHQLPRSATEVFSVGGSFCADLTELILSFGDDTPVKNPARLAWRLALVLDSLVPVSASKAGTVATVRSEKLLLQVSALAAAHLGEPLSVPQLARKLGFSSSHLRQRFHQVAGVSLGRFLREFRLRHAAELLATGQANVTEASAACGWDTPYAFSRAFRHYWGRAPKAFALAHRQ